MGRHTSRDARLMPSALRTTTAQLGTEDSRRKGAPTLNIVVVSLDTLRRDRLTCYGYDKPTTPYLDTIARQGVRFAEAYVSDIPTEVAHTGLFCGRWGAATGIVSHGHPYPALPETVTWLPEALRRAGLTTAAIDNLYQLKTWFARGFRYYVNMVSQQRWIDGADVTQEAVDWLRQHYRTPFFLFVHYWDPHSPYLPPPGYYEPFYPPGRDPFDPARHDMERAYNHLAYPFFKRHHYDLLGPVTDPEYLSARYDGEVRYLDDQLQRLDQTLAELGIWQDTWLILIADHGESLTEHDIFWDHCGLYEPTVHIPLIMRWPAKMPAGRTVSEFVQQIDVVPTIYEALGISAAEPIDGMSLWPLLSGDGPWPRDRVHLSECAWQAARGIRTASYKYIETLDSGVYERPPRELYRVSDDPGETQNLVEAEPGLAEQFAQELRAWVARWGDQDPMLPIVQNGLPFVRRMDQILREAGMSWENWKHNPNRAWYDAACERTRRDATVRP